MLATSILLEIYSEIENSFSKILNTNRRQQNCLRIMKPTKLLYTTAKGIVPRAKIITKDRGLGTTEEIVVEYEYICYATYVKNILQCLTLARRISYCKWSCKLRRRSAKLSTRTVSGSLGYALIA